MVSVEEDSLEREVKQKWWVPATFPRQEKKCCAFNYLVFPCSDSRVLQVTSRAIERPMARLIFLLMVPQSLTGSEPNPDPTRRSYQISSSGPSRYRAPLLFAMPIPRRRLDQTPAGSTGPPYSASPTLPRLGEQEGRNQTLPPLPLR